MKIYTAFEVEGAGHYQFKTMIFGLINSQKTYHGLIDALFGPENDPNVFAYLDDLIIISEDFKSHLQFLENVLQTLLKVRLRINGDKCEFACSSVTYLGYLLDEDGLRPEPERIKPVFGMPSPKNSKELRRVLGMFGWYSRFIENEADRKIPLVKFFRHFVGVWPEKGRGFSRFKASTH